MPSIKPKVDEVVKAMADTSIKYRSISIDHPELEDHYIVMLVKGDRGSTSRYLYIGIEGPVHHARAKLVLESLPAYSCRMHIADWSTPNKDRFINYLFQAILKQMQLDKLIPMGDKVV